MNTSDLDTWISTWRPRIDRQLADLLEDVAKTPGCPAKLSEAMSYSLLGPGKRLRPLVCLAATRAAGGEESRGLVACCSLEFVHAYSLIHDDLPSMDDDDFRRGRPSCHKAFGEALAILTGDALLTHAFAVLALGLEPLRAHAGVGILAWAAGATGMVGGQVDDVLGSGDDLRDAEGVESVHLRKTGRLLEASARLGGLVAAAGDAGLAALGGFGWRLGLAFQIADDILSCAGDAETLGRPTGSDEAHGRWTHPRAVGQDASRERFACLMGEAVDVLDPFGDRARELIGLAELVSGRVERDSPKLAGPGEVSAR